MGQLPCFLDERVVPLYARIAQGLEAIHTFVGFLVNRSELRLEFGTRTSTPGSAVIPAYRCRCPTQLARLLLRFIGLRKLATKLDDRNCEQTRSFLKVARRHAAG